MAYDHNKKAGNEGDIVKHPALIATIDGMCNLIQGNQFRYVDVFAGYSFNPISKGNEWKQGIGNIFCNRSQAVNRSLKHYFDWYLSRPQLLGGVYPGSSTIAFDTIKSKNKAPLLTLFDTSDKVIQNLTLSFDKTSVEINHRAAGINDVLDADLLFIDPPGLYSRQKGGFPRLEELVLLGDAPRKGNTLIWLPVTVSTATKPPSESKATIEAIDNLVNAGYDITKVLWAVGGRVMGCFMAYKLPKDIVTGLRSTIESMVELTDWDKKQVKPVLHIDA